MYACDWFCIVTVASVYSLANAGRLHACIYKCKLYFSKLQYNWTSVIHF